ncbi:MAG: class I SAM-dependent methyltransferase, partial [Alphaproteobacteria bacterium]|nr:class I SAM-dependent methyltransferase [Alphaproteobacteria bacterium]
CPNVHFINLNLFEVHNLNDNFDFVFSNGVLHHTPDPIGAIRSLGNVCAPGGIFYLSLYHRGRFLNHIQRTMLKIFAGNNWDKRLKLAKKFFPRACLRHLIHFEQNDDNIKDVWLADRFGHPHQPVNFG